MCEGDGKRMGEALVAENERLRRENEELRRQIEDLQRRLGELEGKLEELQQKAFRQAAPFRVPEHKRKSNPKPPGRKAGHPASWRRAPEHVDEERIIPLERCPHCGGPVEDVKPVEQFIEDIPPVRVHVTRLVTHRGRCARCGAVESTDPLQVSRAVGSAKCQVGPRALGLAAKLKNDLGLTYSKCQEVIGFLGLRVTRGALAQALERVAERIRPLYEQIGTQIRAGTVAHADETSWYVGRPGWWLWVFADRLRTLYVVDEGRGAAVVEAVLGEHYGGVLVSDCLTSYDPMVCKKQKCYAHHLRALSESLEVVGGEGAEVLKELQLLLQTAMLLGRMRGVLAEDQWRLRVEQVRGAVGRILDGAHRAAGLEKALGRFRKHRSHLFTFLDVAGVEPTNNLAQRQLRPAVIGRKVSCGNRTERGKRTWEVLTSIAATCEQQGRSFVDLVAQAMPLRAPPPALAA